MRAIVANSTWDNLKRWLPGLLISVIALWLVLRNISFESFSLALAQINPSAMAFVIVLYFISLGIRAFCWQILLRRKASYPRVLLVLGEGYLLNNLLPLRVGELARAVLLGKGNNLGFFKVLSTIVVERAFDMAIASCLLLGTIPFVLKMDASRPLAIGILTIVVIGLFALYWMARYRDRVESLAARLGGRWGFVQKQIVPKLDSILDGFSALTQPRIFIFSLSLIILSWSASIFGEYIILRNLIPEAQFWWVGLVLGAAAIGAAVPSAPAAIGVYEGFTVGALSLVGIDPARGLAFAILVHLVVFSTSTILGVAGLIREGASLTSLYKSLSLKRN